MKHHLVLLLGLQSCTIGGALTAQPTATELRYFSPEGATVRTTAAAVGSAGAPALTLDRVTSSASLRSRIVHRDSAYELGMYDTMRWTDNPEVYIRRALARVLFDEGIVREEASGAAPTLDVDVMSFEEVRTRERHAGRVELRYTLSSGDHVIATGIAAAEEPAQGRDMSSVVAAIGRAMDEAVGQIAERVKSSLASK